MSWDNDPLVKTAAPAVAPWDADPVVDRRKQPRAAKGFVEAWQAGYQGSLPGLVDRGKLPDIVVDRERSTFLEQLTSTASQMINEMPESILGAVVGGMAAAPTGPIGSMVGAGAGGMALPTALRESYIQALEKGQVVDAGDFFSRAKIVFKKTGIDAAIGGMLGPAQLIASRGVGKAIAPMIGESIAVPTATKAITGAGIGAEVSLMAAAPALLHEGRLPDWQDFANAGVLVAGMRVASGVGTKAGERVKEGYAKALNDAPEIGRKLGQIYAKTGIRPEQVVADAKVDPVLAAELRGETVKPEPTRANADMDAGAKLETKPDPLAEFGSEIPKAYEPLRRELMVRDALQDEGHAMRIADVLTNPEGRVTAEKEPNHINYKYVESPDDVKAVHARIAEVFEAQLNEARGKESWEKTQESAAQLLAERGLKAEGGDFNKLAAKGMAWEAMAQRAAHDVQQAAAEVRALDKAADPVAHAEATKKMVLAIENAAFLHAIDQANGAEIARALAARKAAKQTAALAKDVGNLFAQYGHDPKKLADLIGELDTTAKVTKFAKEAAKATTFDKYIEALKSGLVSGPISQIKNIMGNSTFLVARPLIDAAAVIGGKVNISEPALRVIGNIQGLLEALEIGAGFARANWNVPMQAIRALDKGDTKSESYKNAIGGDLGVIVRTPFTALRVADTTFRMMIERGEINTLAAREAAKERYNPLTAEFRQRMAELAQNPTEAMLKSAEQAGLRFTFNAELGPAGRAFQRLLDEAPILKVFVPFVRTPGNVFKEMFRLTPFAPFIDTWRADFNKGGADRHKAYAEVVIGSLLAGTVMAMVNDKKDKWITGQLDADPAKKNIQLAAGMQPYSVKIQGKWYDYSALQPLGTLLGLAVDIAQAWDLIGTQEQDKIVRVLSIGFANSVTNQTFLQGAVSITHLLTEPDRYGPKIMQSLAAMHVPSILAQNAALMDPYVREINGVLDAVKNRIPGVRETLFAQRDPFGEQIKNPERLGVVSPIKTRTPETDPVYTEAARLGVGVSRTPKNIELPTKIGDKKLGKVELTPEQRDIFGDKAGNFAYDILEPIVGTPAWNAAPDLQRKQTYDRVFQKANQVGKWEALTPEQRAIEFHRIQTEITYRLYQAGPAVE